MKSGSGVFAHLLVAVVLGALAACESGSRSDSEVRADRALALEIRLLAPCCWVQTLDVHESAEASSLRAEIRTRLARGESAAAIEDDFADRFGERIRAVPKGREPRNAVPEIVGIAMLVSALGIFLLARVWTRRTRAEDRVADDGAISVPKDAYDDQLDDELRRIDDNS
ncbi:MAG: cytochrome c-type biogenesis protein CcmH [Sandaracinaceae bacterium]|nr:cytochrome c-type biogenesis protein CcmH [Sandaracinaceae bacterium]